MWQRGVNCETRHRARAEDVIDESSQADRIVAKCSPPRGVTQKGTHSGHTYRERLTYRDWLTYLERITYRDWLSCLDWLT